MSRKNFDNFDFGFPTFWSMSALKPRPLKQAVSSSQPKHCNASEPRPLGMNINIIINTEVLLTKRKQHLASKKWAK